MNFRMYKIKKARWISDTRSTIRCYSSLGEIIFSIRKKKVSQFLTELQCSSFCCSCGCGFEQVHLFRHHMSIPAFIFLHLNFRVTFSSIPVLVKVRESGLGGSTYGPSTLQSQGDNAFTNFCIVSCSIVVS